MGIPYYFYNIYKKYEDDNLLIDEADILVMNDIEYLFFDYNSLIHPCAQKVLLTIDRNDEDDIENAIISETIDYTRYIISIMRAKKVYIMIDGIPPMGKLIQQRERRYKSYFFKKYQVNESKENPGVFWDSNCISPGTKFMKRLKIGLDKLSFELSNIIISDSLEIGEGEHKIMRLLNNLEKCDEKVMIYGLDSDLIMLSLMNKFSDKIMLLRDNADRGFSYVNISKLKSCVYRDITKDVTKTFEINRIIDDYILICFLLGNDFIGHIPSLTIKDNGMNVINKCYIKTITKHLDYLVNKKDNTINKNIFLTFIGELSNLEDYYYKKIYKYTEYSDVQVTNNDNIYYYRDNYIDFSGAPKEYKRAYYIYYNNSCSKKKIDDYCKEWLDSINWIYGYYNNHVHDNWNSFYKYNRSPFISDIYNYLKNNNYEFKEITPDSPIDIKTQLRYILPEYSLRNELDESEQMELEIYLRVPENRYKIPNKIYIDLINKKWLWESNVIM